MQDNSKKQAKAIRNADAMLRWLADQVANSDTQAEYEDSRYRNQTREFNFNRYSNPDGV